VYKEDHTQNSDPERTSYTPFSLVTLFSINYHKIHKSEPKKPRFFRSHFPALESAPSDKIFAK